MRSRLIALLGKLNKPDVRLYERDGRAGLSKRHVVVSTVMEFDLRRIAQKHSKRDKR